MVTDTIRSFDLIKRNTEEIVSETELRTLLREKQTPTGYWGTATTGRIHIGYLIPMSKIADFLTAGVQFTILLADIHAHLDDQKSPWDLLDHRVEYYREVILGMLQGLNVDVAGLKFVRGTEFELKPDYVLDLLRLTANLTLNRTKRAGAEVVRQKEDPKLGSFIYPLMQSLDVPYLEADIAFGGIDQRGIYMLSRDVLPDLGYAKPICVFNPMLPGLTGEKMSASDDASKIDCLDTQKVVEKKMQKSYCPAKEVKANGVLSFAKTVIFPWLERSNRQFILNRPPKYGGRLVFNNYEELEASFVNGDLHPLDLKKGSAVFINEMLDGVRRRFEKKQALLEEAYPEK